MAREIMRDFFWFAFMSFALHAVADYHSTMKPVSIAARRSQAKETIHAQPGPLILANGERGMIWGPWIP